MLLSLSSYQLGLCQFSVVHHHRYLDHQVVKRYFVLNTVTTTLIRPIIEGGEHWVCMQPLPPLMGFTANFFVFIFFASKWIDTIWVKIAPIFNSLKHSDFFSTSLKMGAMCFLWTWCLKQYDGSMLKVPMRRKMLLN